MWMVIIGVAVIAAGMLILYMNLKDTTSSMETVSKREVIGVTVVLIGILVTIASGIFLSMRAWFH